MLNLASPKKSSGFGLFLKTVQGRAYPRVVGMLREKTWMFFDIFLPLLSVSAFALMYKAIGAPEEYLGFVVIGGAMTSFWMNVLWAMSSQLYWEKETGNLPLYILSPASLMGILLGMAVGGWFSTLLRAVVIIAIGSWIFEVTYVVSSLSQLLWIFFLCMGALYGLGMMTASFFLLLSREAWHLANLASEPVYLISGMYFPVKNLGFWTGAFASFIPLTLGLDAMRQVSFANGALLGFLDVKLEIMILAALFVVYLVSSYFLIKYIEKLAIREGRLTENKR